MTALTPAELLRLRADNADEEAETARVYRASAFDDIAALSARIRSSEDEARACRDAAALLEGRSLMPRGAA